MILPFVFFISLILYIFGHRKITQGLKMRWPIDGKLPWQKHPKQTKPIWFHCSSGEFEYAKPVITGIKKRNPNTKILVTYFTPTYKKNIEAFPLVDYSCPLPWDLPGPMRQFVHYHQPECLYISRTDLWPEMLNQTKLANIPTYLFSVTAQKTNIKNIIAQWLKKILLTKVDRIFCVSKSDAINLNSLTDKNKVIVVGDTRYDQVFVRLSQPKPLDVNLKPNKLCFIMGSTWPQDEKVLFISLAKVIKDNDMQAIIAPHEPTEEHLKQLSQYANKSNLSFRLYSEAKDNDYDLLIIDKVGILAELYEWADIAFIGGSFKKSVHSVMEALASGCYCIVGPCHKNNREAIEFQNQQLHDSSLVTCVNNAQELTDTIHQLASNCIRPNSKADIVKLIKSKTGATEKLLQEIPR